jgi:hypothetical protein
MAKLLNGLKNLLEKMEIQLHFIYLGSCTPPESVIPSKLIKALYVFPMSNV